MAGEAPKSKDGSRLALNAARAEAATGSSDHDLRVMLINQVAASLWTPNSMMQEQRNLQIQGAIAALVELAPRDGLEGMLAVQMVATHSAAMECLRRAMLDGQTFEGRDLALKHATKLLALYARQVETLDKHRGQGQQKITVEHVTVNAGGQAIVGSVETAARRGPALEHNPGTTAPELEATVAPAAKPAARKVRRD